MSRVAEPASDITSASPPTRTNLPSRIATAVAVAVGYLVFSGQVATRSSKLLDRLTDASAELTLVALVLTTIEAYLAKAGAWVSIAHGAVFVVAVLLFRAGIVGEIAKRRKVSL